MGFDGGGGMGGLIDPNSWSSAIDKDVTSMGGRDTTNVMKAGGDVTALKEILAKMAASSSPEGMQALIQEIFKVGTAKELPGLFNNANVTGVRPQSSTTNELMVNDLVARLTGQATMALGQQQKQTADAAAAFAQLTEKPIATKISGEGKASGSTNRLSLFGEGIGLWS